jgi:hypothetical protein
VPGTRPRGVATCGREHEVAPTLFGRPSTSHASPLPVTLVGRAHPRRPCREGRRLLCFGDMDPLHATIEDLPLMAIHTSSASALDAA